MSNRLTDDDGEETRKTQHVGAWTQQMLISCLEELCRTLPRTSPSRLPPSPTPRALQLAGENGQSWRSPVARHKNTTGHFCSHPIC